ncbi:chemotaxis protein methyltransferase CheR [Sphingobium xanthum]|jgi:chemotaxis protein methyltransferase CheR|uniref:CheR family methyltransferase n=1 Tax=Sphingobium xanthum TaxID=1387165 RepID=UPI001C8CBEFC|nr:protein-glutamate O-methyltransferase CheR [Sphingobium xanthum]
MNAPAFQSPPGVSSQIYGEADFEAIRAIIHREAGIALERSKAMLVYSRLAPLVRSSNSATFANYIKLIESDATERHQTVCALTTNHTFFYREAHHFDHLRDVSRPMLMSQIAHGDPVRIWSAGSSSGEEGYSILMTLLGPDKADARRIFNSDFLMLGTDLADHAVAGARAARYAANAVDPVPEALRNLWTERDGNAVQIKQEVRDLAKFLPLNLLGPWPMKRQFDIIFCRNVMIYFDQPTKERLVARFAEALRPGGFLYIGHSERVTGQASAMLEPAGNTIYVRGTK